jgi:hypothetical protein
LAIPSFAWAQDPQPAPPPPQGLSSKVFNPDISVIGNFVGIAGRNPASTEPSMSLAEVEAAFQAVVDAYAKADFFIGLGSEGAEVEEGFITFTSLPANLLLKVGKMRAQFGKLNTLHTHRLPSVDRSLVTDNLLGGEEGLSDAGMSLSYLVHNPALFLEITQEVYQGESEVFQTSRRARLAYVSHVRGYRDLTEDKNLELGTSVAWGPADAVVDPDAAPIELSKRLIGFDATFRYRPLRRSIYRSFNLRTEAMWSRQELPEADPVSSSGFFVTGEFQFARRWYIGARLDRSGRAAEVDAIDKGGALFLTFWPTEFSQIRTQYRETRYAEGTAGHEFLFQFNFSIGAHGAHVF